MPVVVVQYHLIGETKLQNVKPALVLADESPSLCAAFRKALMETPRGFKYRVELEGFAPIDTQWMPSCSTAGALLISSFRASHVHDLIAILLNGVETKDELAAIAAQYPLRPDIWSQALSSPKPLVTAAAFTVGRIREPATVTVINAFANSFFAQFGTN